MFVLFLDSWLKWLTVPTRDRGLSATDTYVRGFKSSAINKLLHREGIPVSALGIRRFLATYNRTGMYDE